MNDAWPALQLVGAILFFALAWGWVLNLIDWKISERKRRIQ